jgi:hypothetical protein
MSAATGQLGEMPAIRVTRGNPAPAELAAVLAVLLTARSAAPAAPEPARSRWAEHAFVRATLPRPGPRSWRASALPR